MSNSTAGSPATQDSSILSAKEKAEYERVAESLRREPGLEGLDHSLQVCRDLSYLDYEAGFHPYVHSYQYDTIIWRISKSLDRYFKEVARPNAGVVAYFVGLLARLADYQRDASAWERVERRNYTPEPGWVYLLKAATGHYKIGRTRNPENRIETFNVKLPFEVEYHSLYECNDHIGFELYLQTLYAHKNVNGEWFALDDKDLADIKEYWELVHVQWEEGEFRYIGGAS